MADTLGRALRKSSRLEKLEMTRAKPVLTRHYPIELDNISLDGALKLLKQPGGGIVVTPNLSHIATLERSDSLVEAYALAVLKLTDGYPVLVLSRALHQKTVERVSGSDLTSALSLEPGRGRRIALVGGSSTGSNTSASDIFRASGWAVMAEPAPPETFQNDTLRRKLVKRICDQKPGVTLIGVGSPKQEQLAVELFKAGCPGWILCVGASIDFLSGEKRRSPRLLQKFGLEWLHRAISEPRRLGGRYARDAPVFISVAIRSVLQRYSK